MFPFRPERRGLRAGNLNMNIFFCTGRKGYNSGEGMGARGFSHSEEEGGSSMENQLTVALEEVQRLLTLEDLSGALGALSSLLRAVERHAREQGPSGTTWRVASLHHSVPTVVIAPDPATKTAAEAVQFVMSTVRRLETGERLNRSLTPPEEEALNRFASYAAHYRIHLRGEGPDDVVITTQTQKSLSQLRQGATREHGTVEGRLEMVTIRGRMECSVYDALTGHRVRCVFDDAMLNDLLACFGQQVVAEGEIVAHAGRVEMLQLERLRPAHPSQDISLDTYFGIGQDWFDKMPAADLVHRVWGLE